MATSNNIMDNLALAIQEPALKDLVNNSILMNEIITELRNGLIEAIATACERICCTDSTATVYTYLYDVTASNPLYGIRKRTAAVQWAYSSEMEEIHHHNQEIHWEFTVNPSNEQCTEEEFRGYATEEADAILTECFNYTYIL